MKRIRNIYQIYMAVQNRKSLCEINKTNRIPAAVIWYMPISYVFRLITEGLYIYEKEK